MVSEERLGIERSPSYERRAVIRFLLVMYITRSRRWRRTSRLTQAFTDNKQQLQELIASLGEKTVVTNPATIDNYRWDRANNPGAGTPLAVVRATNAEDVQTTVRLAPRRAYRSSLGVQCLALPG